MALVFQDGFDVWGSGSTSRTNMLNSSNMWVSFSTPMGCTTTVSRTGTHSLYQIASGGSVNDDGAIFSLGAVRTSADGYHGFGFALRISNLPTSTTKCVYVNNSTGLYIYSLHISPTGALLFCAQNTSTTVYGISASGLITPNVFTNIEIKQKIQSGASATDGEFYVKVNGAQVIGVTGTDVIVTSTINAETVSLLPGSGASSFGSCYIDDLYVWDSTGTYCNDWIGNKASYTYFCDADTATADWTINGTTYGYEAINDTTPDADSTYLAATAVNDESIFEIGGVNTSLTGIKAVTVQSLIRQDAEGSSEIMVSLGGATYSDATARVAPFPGVSSSTYTAHQDHFYQDPDGTGDLTPTIINALKLKLKRTV